MRSVWTYLYIVLVFWIRHVLAHTAEEWRSRIVYQIITDRFALGDTEKDSNCVAGLRKFCGGTWKGIERRLGYLEELGVNAVLVPLKHLELIGEPYHGYWTKDLTSLNDHFGTEKDLQSLIDECHKRDIWVMLDITINNFAVAAPIKDSDYSSYKPFNKKEHYHPFCPMDYADDESVLNCWLGDENVQLMDLNTENKFVIEKTREWVQKTVNKYKFDGIRIDALKHIPQPFFPPFVQAAGVYSTGEMFTADPRLACEYQNNSVDAVLNFPLHYGMTYAFNGTGMDVLTKLIGDMRKECKDPTLLGTFSENHDVPRFASVTEDQARGVSMLAFTVLWDGIPTLYYGSEQHFTGGIDPENREALWDSGYDTKNPYFTMTKLCIAFRKMVMQQDPTWAASQSTVIDSSPFHLVFQKKDVLAIMGNWGVEKDASVDVPESAYTPGTELIDIVSRQKFVVGADGALANVPIVSGNPCIFYPSAMFNDSLALVNTEKEPVKTFTPKFKVTTEYYMPPYKNKHVSGGSKGQLRSGGSKNQLGLGTDLRPMTSALCLIITTIFVLFVL